MGITIEMDLEQGHFNSELDNNLLKFSCMNPGTVEFNRVVENLKEAVLSTRMAQKKLHFATSLVNMLDMPDNNKTGKVKDIKEIITLAMDMGVQEVQKQMYNTLKDKKWDTPFGSMNADDILNRRRGNARFMRPPGPHHTIKYEHFMR